MAYCPLISCLWTACIMLSFRQCYYHHPWIVLNPIQTNILVKGNTLHCGKIITDRDTVQANCSTLHITGIRLSTSIVYQTFVGENSEFQQISIKRKLLLNTIRCTSTINTDKCWQYDRIYSITTRKLMTFIWVRAIHLYMQSQQKTCSK